MPLDEPSHSRMGINAKLHSPRDRQLQIFPGEFRFGKILLHIPVNFTLRGNRRPSQALSTAMGVPCSTAPRTRKARLFAHSSAEPLAHLE